MPSQSRLEFGDPVQIRIRVEGAVPEIWIDRLGGLTVSVIWQEGTFPVTVLTGRIQDQAALMGVLSTLHDLHLPIVSVDSAINGITDE